MRLPDFMTCPITGLAVRDSAIFKEQYAYSIKVGDILQKILIPINYSQWSKDSFYFNNKHIIAGLLLKAQLFNFEEDYQPLSLDYIIQRFNESIFPRTPQEKYDNLMRKFFELQDYEGALIDISDRYRTQEFFYSLFFKNPKELIFYIKTLEKDGLLSAVFTGYENDDLQSCNLTYKGLSYVLKLLDEGKQSRNCFVAMSFGADMGPIRNAIKEACSATGYTPVLVDEVHYDSDTTINDAIVANLKKSRFCIADFTEQKDGVYFESGFALGQGKQVIYSCREDYFKASHFDTNHFPHIVYKDPEELKKGLIDKIEAWIR